MDEHLLDNIVWHALTGPQAHFAAGRGAARRYAPGFSPIVGFEDPEHPDFDALRPFCAVGESFYCDGWSRPAPAGWQVDTEATMFKMVWQGGIPLADAPQATPPLQPLGPGHAQAALALATLTRPGPFGPRTIELGDYVGCFDANDGSLVAMAGERMQAGRLREISGVCTHPGAQGRGLARRLMLHLVARQLARGETPFLHVMRANTLAHALYERMGFVTLRESVVRVVSRRD
jgi:GNAT superfamily N-acetyltransferase